MNDMKSELIKQMRRSSARLEIAHREIKDLMAEGMMENKDEIITAFRRFDSEYEKHRELQTKWLDQ